MNQQINSGASQQARSINVDVLINEGVFLTREIKRLQERLKEVKDAMDVFFPAEKTEEVIVTEFGIATRRVCNSWSIYDERIDQVKGILGEVYPDFVKEEVRYKVTPKLRSLVLDADNKLGEELRTFVYVDQNVSISFREKEDVNQLNGQTAEAQEGEENG